MTAVNRELVWSQISVSSLRSLAPDALTSFDTVIGAVVTAADPRLLELLRQRISTLLGAAGDELPSFADLPPSQQETLARWPTSPAFSTTERTCLEFAEQFVLDVARTSDDDRASLGAALGPGTFGFVQAVYVLDHGLRLSLTLRQLFGVDPLQPISDPAAALLWPALESMMTAVVCLHALDPFTSELVRLRGAAAHNCRLCRSRRSVDAAAENGPLLEQVENYEHASFSESQLAALRLTDAILSRPAALPAGVLRQVRSMFSPAEALEIGLDVVRNASNKIAVALGADQPKVASGVEYFDVTGSGEYRYGLAAPARSGRTSGK
jgi:alkylhydroperoxidase family enzyme